MFTRRRIATTLAALSLTIGGAAACTSTSQTQKNTNKEQSALQKTKNTNEQKLTRAEPFPQAKMNDSAERANLAERLLRTNQPHKVGYLYILNNLGTPIGYYVVKGKVSSTGSEMTNSQQLVGCGQNNEKCVIEAMDDDGSYGPSEGGDKGIFFFTESDVLVETDQGWMYSDAPLALKVPLLITKDATPTSKGGVDH